MGNHKMRVQKGQTMTYVQFLRQQRSKKVESKVADIFTESNVVLTEKQANVASSTSKSPESIYTTVLEESKKSTVPQINKVAASKPPVTPTPQAAKPKAKIKNTKVLGALVILGGLAYLAKKGYDYFKGAHIVTPAEEFPLDSLDAKLVEAAKIIRFGAEEDSLITQHPQDTIVKPELTKEEWALLKQKNPDAITPLDTVEINAPKDTVIDEFNGKVCAPLTKEVLDSIERIKQEREEFLTKARNKDYTYKPEVEQQVKEQKKDNAPDNKKNTEVKKEQKATNVSKPKAEQPKKAETSNKPAVKQETKTTQKQVQNTVQKTNTKSDRFYIAKKGSCVWNTIKKDLAQNPDAYKEIKQYLTKKYGKEPSTNTIIAEATNRTLKEFNLNHIEPGDTIKVPRFVNIK
ncbi:hypothetical protein IJ750_05155 [bacterium]|nr:hypothetical protein [bacterium]